MDVTIRDGSYLIDYQYTTQIVARTAAYLDEAGIGYMEVGHGCGLGASQNLGFKAGASDLDYVKAAKSNSKSMKVGVIAASVPTTTSEDIQAIIDEVDFIRFAGNCDSPKDLRSHINLARRLRPDVEIFFQMMRCSRCPLDKIIDSAKTVSDMGANIVYVVDTAGNLLPEEIDRIISRLVKNLKIPVGFHGHNNLDMAVANSIAAVKAGASIIDASLRGVGRAAGNAQLEIVVSILQRMGLAKNIDLDLLLIAADSEIECIMPQKCGISSLDVITAVANIDIYPQKRFERISNVSGINLIDIIQALGEDKTIVEPTTDSISRVLQKLGADADSVLKKVGLLQATPSRPAPAPAKRKIKVVCALKTPNLPYNFEDWMLTPIIQQFPNVEFLTADYKTGMIEGLAEAEVLHSFIITPEMLSLAKKLKWFHSAITGPDKFIFQELIDRKIIISTPRGVHSIPIAETVIGLMLSHCRKIRTSIIVWQDGVYDSLRVLNDLPRAFELEGSNVTIFGIGGIGTELAIRCKDLGMKVTGVVPSVRGKPGFLDKQILFENRIEAINDADFIVLSCPNTPQTANMIGAAEFAAMKKTAYLINVARAELIDETELLGALDADKIAGAASDVFLEEPLSPNSPFLKAKNLTVLPHISGISGKYWMRDLVRFSQNLRRYLDGEPIIGELDFNRGY
jgi:4-hydroxy-2-oxovalerate aldolase